MVWEQGSRLVLDLTVLGFVPVWRQCIEIQEIDDKALSLRTNEHGGPFRSWRHSIQVRSIDASTSEYTDIVEFDVRHGSALFAFMLRRVFGYRHLRWRRLVKRMKARTAHG